MLQQKGNSKRKEGSNGLVAVAIDRDKNSQNALKWAIEHVLERGQTVILVHVKVKYSSAFSPSPYAKLATSDSSDDNFLVCNDPDQITKDLFVPFRCFCTRKNIQCKEVVLEDSDVSKGLIEYATRMTIDTLVLGTTTKYGIFRFRTIDIPASVLKGAPDFCTVYVVSKGKISFTRAATRPSPAMSTLCQQMQLSATRSTISETPHPQTSNMRDRLSFAQPRKSHDEFDTFRSPFTRKGLNGTSYGETLMPDSDISFVSSGRPSSKRMSLSSYETESILSSHLSNSIDSLDSLQFGRKSLDLTSSTGMSSLGENGRLSASQQPIIQEDQDGEMRRLKLELKQTMEMYSTACKEALTAKQKASELQRWKSDEVRKVEETITTPEEEKTKSSEAANTIAEVDAQKRRSAKVKRLGDGDEKKKTANGLADTRYRRYSIEEIETATEFFADSLKIGEGGYGPVYKSYLDHTPVAIKVLRPDAAQGRSQFNQEVEVLSCIRHPNMVLLLGACPEYGCLVYEFMANGSLDDCLFRQGNTPPLPWQLRFRIAAEIGTGLLFLHNAKPEPLVHRDLKPGNILLDRNFVSKISDVGLARLVPASVADTVTQYHMTSTAGTFCYIDPEYQQTGMLGVKSDIYSLGIIFLQLLTARSPMGLSHHVERAIENGNFKEMLDPDVHDWPYEDALRLAKLSLRCAELRRKDRPNLGKVILPELNRLRTLAEDSLYAMMYRGGPACLTVNTQESA